MIYELVISIKIANSMVTSFVKRTNGILMGEVFMTAPIRGALYVFIFPFIYGKTHLLGVTMSFLRKLLGRKPKEDTKLFLFRGLFSSTISYIVSASESPSEANQILKNMGREAAEMLFQKYLEVGEIHANLEKIPYDFNYAYKTFAGEEFDDIWSLVPEGKQLCEIHFRIYDNPTSKNLKSPNPEIKVDNFMAGVMEWSFQLLKEDLNVQEVSSDEIKCQAAGDDYCEYKVSFKWEEGVELPLTARDQGVKVIKGSIDPHK